MEKTNRTAKETKKEEQQDNLHVELSVEQALLFDDDGRFCQTLMATLDKSINYYDQFTKGKHTPEEFEQAEVLLKSFKAAKKVVSKMTKKAKREKTSFLQ